MRSRRQDANHAEIRTAFRDLGFAVRDTFQLPEFCDMYVEFGGIGRLIEVKDGSKPPSARIERESQEKLKAEFKTYRLIENKEDVRKLHLEICREIMMRASGQRAMTKTGMAG